MPPSVADLAALGKMWEEHRPRLLAMLRRRTEASPVDAEDVLQETFLLAQRRWQHFLEQAQMTPYAWLYRLALDCLIEQWRRKHRAGRDQEMRLPERSSILLGLGIVNPGTSPSEAVARGECQEHMRQVLALLKDSDREILWMRHCDELSFKEAAVALGLSENTATRRYVRALERLSSLWKKLHPDPERGP